MNRSILILITAVVVLVACGRSKPFNSSELVGFYVYKSYESPKPTNYQSLSLRADGTYTLIRDDQPPLSGHWNFSDRSPLNLGLDDHGYSAEGRGRSIKIIDNPDVKAWFVKVSDVPK